MVKKTPLIRAPIKAAALTFNILFGGALGYLADVVTVKVAGMLSLAADPAASSRIKTAGEDFALLFIRIAANTVVLVATLLVVGSYLCMDGVCSAALLMGMLLPQATTIAQIEASFRSNVVAALPSASD